MTLLPWIEQHAHGFAQLSDAERQTIADFSIVWALFEAKVMAERADPPRLRQIAAKWEEVGLLAAEPFTEALAYFQDRYFENGEPTGHFPYLKLPEGVHTNMVRDVLKGDPASASDKAAAVLLVIYRYRNNLFHGGKLAYGVADQKANFDVAIAALKTAIDLHVATFG